MRWSWEAGRPGRVLEVKYRVLSLSNHRDLRGRWYSEVFILCSGKCCGGLVQQLMWKRTKLLIIRNTGEQENSAAAAQPRPGLSRWTGQAKAGSKPTSEATVSPVMDFTGTLPRRYSGETQEVVSSGGKTPKRTEHYLNDRGLDFVFCRDIGM